MRPPRVNPVGVLEAGLGYAATPRRYPLPIRLAAGLLLAVFLTTGVVTTVRSLAAYCLTTDAGAPFSPPAR